MKKIVFFMIFLCNISLIYPQLNSSFKVIQGRNTLDEKGMLLDINRASKADMLKVSISKGYVDKIIEYRDITGGFKNLKDMRRISGIGKKTFERLKVFFKISSNITLKNFNINSANLKVLKYYGFNKKEIKKIEIFRKKQKIRNNNQFKKIISKEKYKELKDIVSF
ncbi:helix-hairpin-helix domain-containing protein [uncultured Cetobacterium sp.]|uniref:helix-hairpin-helix domain-containing protein n=1 Tax=uncultured Cetobacterium sp. TaxID=527638 RepID=UPI002613CF04|nr:helix-hairpin-helix domain-containing protein [uncultured Cetobacterium sp.]